MKKKGPIPDDDVLVRNFSGFLARATYLRSHPTAFAEVAVENCAAQQLCEAILEASDGMPRQHVIAALVVVIGHFMEEWREEEELLTRPVQ